MNPSFANNTILIVDDTPDNLTVLRKMLTQQGYKIRPAINGEIALKMVLGEGAESVLSGAKIIPKRTLDSGYTFKYSQVDESLINLLKK